jgi:hypothetical protein
MRVEEMFESVDHRDEGVNSQREREDPEEKFHVSDPSFHNLDCADAGSARRTLFYPKIWRLATHGVFLSHALKIVDLHIVKAILQARR